LFDLLSLGTGGGRFNTCGPNAGTGLGLSQVFGFVRQLGGFVRLESKAGHGTAVRLYLPRLDRVGDKDTASQKASDSVGQGPPCTTQTICGTVLVVEDETDVHEMIVAVLRDLGCSVLEAQDGRAGLRIVHSRVQVDLLVTDIGLPGLNGRQLADASREVRPGLPVLLIAGYAGKALDDSEFASGMEVMRKPFPLKHLSARVRSLMTRYPSVEPPLRCSAPAGRLGRLEGLA
jgi:CheY-like chemotaxis protein